MEFIQAFGNLIKGIKTLNIPRAEDLPYWTSPPIQFTYQSTASLLLGNYYWTDVLSPLSVNRPILNNALYYFRSITFIADIEQLDFTSNMVTIPRFQMGLVGDSTAVLFRESVLMTSFLQQFDYRIFWMSKQGEDDQLLASFNGQLMQGPGLIGKADITLTAIISAQEIVDDNYINLFLSQYPQSPSNIRTAEHE